MENHGWSSYRKKKNLYESYAKNYKMILQKPERFSDYLGKLGFQVLETIKPTPSNNLKHEIVILQKIGQK